MQVNTISVNIGDKTTGYFDIFSSPVNLTPMQFTITDVTNAIPNSSIISASVILTGLTPECPINLRVTNGLIDAGTVALSDSFAPVKRVLTSIDGTIVVAIQLMSSGPVL